MAFINFSPLDMELGVQRQDADAMFLRQLSVYATVRAGDLKDPHRSISDLMTGWKNNQTDEIKEETESVDLSVCRDFELEVKGKYIILFTLSRQICIIHTENWDSEPSPIPQKCQLRPKRMWLWTHPVFPQYQQLYFSYTSPVIQNPRCIF